MALEARARRAQAEAEDHGVIAKLQRQRGLAATATGLATDTAASIAPATEAVRNEREGKKDSKVRRD